MRIYDLTRTPYFDKSISFKKSLAFNLNCFGIIKSPQYVLS